jgi:DHA1 family inner membrane transport protein
MRKAHEGQPSGLVLAVGVFGIITTEIGLIGVLPEVAARCGVNLSEAGLLVGVFALVVAVSGPFGVLVASRFNRKTILLLTMAVFVLSNLVFAASDSFPLLMVFRILPAILHPVFFSVTLAMATSLAPPGKETGAAARVFAGVTVGFAFGVPAMAYLASQYSLPLAFTATAGVNALALAGIALWVPSSPPEERLTYGRQLQILRRPQLWLQVVTTTLIFAAMFSAYSYFADYLGHVGGVPASIVSALLMVFGVIMIGGNFAFAALIKRSLRATVFGFLGAYILLYLAIYTAAPSAWALSLLVIPWGLIHSGGLLLGQSLISRQSEDAPVFGNSLFVSASNIGITLGSTLSAAQIALTGTRSIAFTGIAITLAAAITALISSTLQAKAHRTLTTTETETELV